ncbi:hypothetical protein [Enterococcus sp. PF1-24]|uniref:aggregation-promoting factor C-terminal-like domain-containing protein n=1 Tax=unclassified Enterococcus TaxID=2608891 RepID=UPI0032AFEF72
MKAKKKLAMLTTLLAINLAMPTFAHAESLNTLNSQENELSTQASEITTQIESALAEADKTFAEVEGLKVKVAENEEKIVTTQQEIAVTQDTIEKRKVVVGERMQDMQVNSSSVHGWQALLEAESFTDFFSRMYAITVLQNAEKEKIDDLNTAKETLESLQTELSETQTTLASNQVDLEVRAQAYIAQVDDLKSQFANNQDLLATVLANKRSEEDRLAAEQAKQAALAQEAEAAQANPAAPEAENNAGNEAGTPEMGSSEPESVPTPEVVPSPPVVVEADEYACKEWVAMRESGGRYDVYSVSGQHYGRYQLMLAYLDGDLSPENQERVADAYVAGRYGSWAAAKQFHLANNWY